MRKKKENKNENFSCERSKKNNTIVLAFGRNENIKKRRCPTNRAKSSKIGFRVKGVTPNSDENFAIKNKTLCPKEKLLCGCPHSAGLSVCFRNGVTRARYPVSTQWMDEWTRLILENRAAACDTYSWCGASTNSNVPVPPDGTRVKPGAVWRGKREVERSNRESGRPWWWTEWFEMQTEGSNLASAARPPFWSLSKECYMLRCQHRKANR